MKNLLLVLALIFTISANAQEDTSKVSPWKFKGLASLQGTQSAFVNWAAGGQNNVTINALVDLNLIYEKNKFVWDSQLKLGYGLSRTFGEGGRFVKTDDQIEFNTYFGYEFHDKVYASALLTYKSQFDKGFVPPNYDSYVSKFMAPGYTMLSLGIDYKPVDGLLISLSPVSGKFTFVLDDSLSNAGAYGVQAAEYDNIGNLVTPGKRFRPELGAYFKVQYKKDLTKNISINTKLELFSNYLDKPQNIDVNAELIFGFKINKWLTTTLQLNYIYDDNIDVPYGQDDDGNTLYGPRSQFKQVLSLGLSYLFGNNKDAK